jgi:hypothetical protein
VLAWTSFTEKEGIMDVEVQALVWSVLYYLGLFAGVYVLTAIGFLLFARLEKDKDGSLLVDPESLHYRACNKCYKWSMCYDNHLEHYKIGICGYFWLVFWAFILIPIGYIIFGVWQILKTAIYAPFMFLFGYYPWPTLKSMQNWNGPNPFAVEVRRISFPRVGKLELKPYLVAFPSLYGWLLWSYPQTTWECTLTILVVVLVIAACYTAVVIKFKVDKSENQRVVLAREYVRAIWRGVCPLLKVSARGGSASGGKT